jgi:hypothetical protein
MPLFRYDSKLNGVVYENERDLGPLLFLPGINVGKVFYLDPVNGNDNNGGRSSGSAVKTLAAGYALLTEGHNDVLALVGNGLSTGSARLSSGFTWAKNAAHLIGVCAPVAVGKRGRIAPTAAVTAFANFFTVSGSGCVFQNLQFFHGFTAGAANMICLTVSGGRNLFVDCDIQGMGDTDGASGADTGSRSLLVTKTGENTFRRCTIGLDTVVRSVANYSVEFLGVTAPLPRNYFERCLFTQWSSANTASALYVAAGGTAGIDRYQIFTDCIFMNCPKTTGYLAATGVLRLGAAQGGIFLFTNPACIGFTGWGYDATSRSGCLIVGGAPAGNATISETGIAVAPTA